MKLLFEFVIAVQLMRDYQNKYFKLRFRSDLEKARQMERKVDGMISAILKDREQLEQSNMLQDGEK